MAVSIKELIEQKEAVQARKKVSVKQSGGFYSILPCEIMLPIKATKFFQLSQFTKCA